MNTIERQPFRIGLVQAGAISAGAYTAGVTDFLIEALDAWEEHRGEPGIPRHEVRLSVISGASAGAITAAIGAIALHSETRPMHWGEPEPEPALNRLYDAWVRKIDIRHLLATDDLEGADPVIRSLLNSNVLQSIAEEAVQTRLRPEPRRYVENPLPIVFSVSNLRGVPYGFKMYVDDKYIMMNHMDCMHFTIGTQPGCGCAERHLDPRDLCGRATGDVPEAWSTYVQSALASGAFPLGLAARHLRRPADDYRDCHATGMVKPSEAIPDPFGFVAVDGGLMDNEPLELARGVLCGGSLDDRAKCNRYGLLTRRALLLIDPFPNVAEPGAPYDEDDRLLQIAATMFSALKDQARFHPDELAAAESEDVYSRFAISPIRRDAQGAIDKRRPMCSACLGGFGGFLKEAFRAYDFHLGRRNCQRFLEGHFALPEENALFDVDPDKSMRDGFYLHDDDGAVIQKRIGIPEGVELSCEASFDPDAVHRLLPIIPLVGSAKPPVDLPPFEPALTEAEWSTLEAMIRKRVKAFGRAAIASELPRVLGRGVGAGIQQWVLKSVLWPALLSRQVTDRVVRAVRAEVPVQQ